MGEYISLAIQNKDVFMTIILLGVIIVVLFPIIWVFIKSLTEIKSKELQKIVDELKGIREDFKQHGKDDVEHLDKIFNKLNDNSVRYITEFSNLKNSLTKNNLPDEDLLEVAIARVWVTSEKKLDFIRKRLEKNNLKYRQDIIKRQIETEMLRRSEEYLIFLNKFNSSVGLIGDWIRANFPMKEFLEEVYDVVFRDLDNHHDRTILTKINDIRFLMMSYQREMFENLRQELNSNK